MDTTTAQPTQHPTKADLAVGDVVRLRKGLVLKTWAVQAGRLVAGTRVEDGVTAYVVKDMFNRASFNEPEKIAVGAPSNGLAFGVLLSDVVLR